MQIFLYYSILMNFLSGLIKILFFIIFLQGVSLAQEVKFVHITDMNINNKNISGAIKTIEEINSYKDIDFVVFGGNNISKANINNLEGFIYLYKKLNKKAIVLLGSSDVAQTTGISKKYYLKRIQKESLKKLHFHSSKSNYVFRKKGYIFVVMDGSKEYFPSLNGYYNLKELSWLDKTLNKYKDKNVIILQHFPIIKTKSNWLETANIEEYQKVLSKHDNVKMVISGHYDINYEKKESNIYNIITQSYHKSGAYKIIQIDLDDNFIASYIVNK